MFLEIFYGILAFIGLMVVMCAVIGIGINFLLFHNWYGETEAQRRDRLRKERAARMRAANDRPYERTGRS